MSHWDSVEAERARAYEDALLEVEGWLSNPNLSMFDESERREAACRIIRGVLLTHSDVYAQRFVTGDVSSLPKDSG